jgi:hypothetical protein
MNEMSAQEKVDYIKDALQSLRDNKISFLTFAMIAGDAVDPVPVTQKDLDWALKTWREIQAGGRTQRAADVCPVCHGTGYKRISPTILADCRECNSTGQRR